MRMNNKILYANIAIIGSGPAGYTAALKLSSEKKRVILIEKYNKIGGVCLHVGCIPSKSMLNIAKILYESQSPSPKTDYGKSKLMAENYILSKSIPPDKKFFILRPCMIHGPYNKGNLNLLFNLISKNIPWFLGSFENKRSYCSIENLLFVINEIIENFNFESGIYNVSDDEALSTNEVILLISKSLEKRKFIIKIPVKIVKLIAKIGDFIKLPLNSERLKKLTESYVVSNKKIIKLIGKPLPVNSKVGLLRTFKSFS